MIEIILIVGSFGVLAYANSFFSKPLALDDLVKKVKKEIVS
jgi:hypothetical protein